MDIQQIVKDKKAFLPLLLLADPEEKMLDRYLERGEMFALYDEGTLRTVAVVTEERGETGEIKNIATDPDSQGKGYGRRMMDYLAERYKGRFKALEAGTGETPASIEFYTACGFQRGRRVEDFFTKNYPQPLIDDGILLRDMIYFYRNL